MRAPLDAVSVTPSNSSALEPLWHDARGFCHLEVSEWFGDALLRFLAVSHVMAANPTSSEKDLSPAAEMILKNKSLCVKAKAIGLPQLALCKPFETSATLPAHRKVALSLKDEADLVEALLGALAVAAVQQLPPSDPRPLNAALGAAFHFFVSAVQPSPPPPDEQPGELSGQLARLNGKVMRRDSSEALEERAAALSMALCLDARQDLLLEVCSWNSNKVFQRLEFYGDAFLQAAVSLQLVMRYPNSSEGELTQMRCAP